MSKGKIIKPRNPNLPDNLHKKPLEDVIFHIIQTCEVEVENTDWQDSDKKLQEKIVLSNTEWKDSDKEILEELDKTNNKIKEIGVRLGNNHGNLSDEIKAIQAEIKDLKSRKPLELKVSIATSKPVDIGKQHCQLPTLLQILATKLNVYLVGPAGAGKTYAAIQCAKALKVPFFFTGAIASEFKLTGFMDAQGRIVSTEFRKAYETGGLFLFDEIDASYPQAVLAFNAALANDYMDFPDKRVERHENFYCIAAANTYGQGADRQYIGRNQLDAASLDRFVFLDWGYDENLERELAGNEEWSNYVQKVRKIITANKIRHVVSPRASIFGARLLANNIERDVVNKTILWKGLDEATIQKIIGNLTPRQIIAEYDGTFTPSAKTGEYIEENGIIGIIEFTKNDYWGGKGTEYRDEIISPCSGLLVSSQIKRKVKVGDIIGEIDTYEYK